MKWAMLIDLKRCTGCGACSLACKQENFVPPRTFRTRYLVGETEGKFPNVKKYTYPVQCNQCEDAVCVEVCPTGATSKRDDGIVVVDPDKCTGCQHCVVSCPYQERSCYYGEYDEYFPGQGLTELEVIGRRLHPYQKGSIVKCDFCLNRIEDGLEKGLKPGTDREATPACVLTCMCKAKIFGDLDDPESEVSKLLEERESFCLNPQFQTKPSVYYLKQF